MVRAPAKQAMKRVAPIPKPHVFVNPFLARARELRGYSYEYRQFLRQEYIRVFDDLPYDVLTNTNLYFRVAYELQARGYREAGLAIPPIVQERIKKSIDREKENIMSPKAAEQREAGKQGRVYKRKPGIRTLLAQLILENSDNKFTDKKILSELRKRAKKQKVQIGKMPMTEWQVQWMRSYIHRHLGKFKIAESTAKRKIRRYDRRGNDITNAHRKKMRRIKSETPKKPAKRLKRKMKRVIRPN